VVVLLLLLSSTAGCPPNFHFVCGLVGVSTLLHAMQHKRSTLVLLSTAEVQLVLFSCCERARLGLLPRPTSIVEDTVAGV